MTPLVWDNYADGDPLEHIDPTGLLLFAFDAWSIFERPGQADSDRVEKRFLGAHSDIGGGYENSDLSDVAFMWMVEQAEKVGLSESVINRQYIPEEQFDEVNRPTANDPVYDLEGGSDGIYTPGLEFRYLDRGGDSDIMQDGPSGFSVGAC